MSRVIAAFTQFFDGNGDPLVNAWLRFLQSSTNNTLKNTYADANLSLPNENPLQLDAEGRCPNVFGQGSYRVDLFYNNTVTNAPGELVQSFDPVSTFDTPAGTGGNFAEWVDTTVYQVSNIVIYNGLYYRSITADNLGNPPDTNTDQWEQIAFLRYYNPDVVYNEDDIVISDGALYFSLVDSNQGNTPLTSPTYWGAVGAGTVLLNWEEFGTVFRPVVSGYNIGDPTHYVGEMYLTAFADFPVTPSTDPTADYHITNKLYVDTGVAGRMNWTGEYVEGASYDTNDVVFDEGWRMIAITETTDRPSPQATGDSLWVYDTFSPAGFSETSVSQNALFVGQRYEYTTSFFTQKLRVFIPTTAIGDELEIWMVYAADTDPSVRIVVPSFVVGEGIVEKWYEIPIGTQFVEAGSVIDFIMLLRPVSGELNFSSTWDYAKANTDPASGQISHLSDASQFLVHAYDYYAVDQSANLDLIVPGSLITMYDTGVTWEVLQVDFASNIYTFTVEPATRSSNAVSVFTFYYYTSSDIYYVYETDLYASDARVSGYIAAEYDPTNSAYFNDNAYGIDIKVQNAVSSADWEVVAYPPDVIAGGGSGSSLVNWEESDTVFRPVTSGDGQLGDATHLISGLYLGDNSNIYVGDGQDLSIVHDGTDSYILNGTGFLSIGTSVATSLYLTTNNTPHWAIDSAGELLPVTDSAYSIGSTSLRVLKLWADDIESTNVPTIAGGSFIDAAVPDQTGYSGYFLTTDGSSVSWGAVALVNWEESGTTFQPKVSGYDLGSTTNLIGNAYFQDTGVIYLGADQDAYIYHNGTNMFCGASVGYLRIDAETILYLRTAGSNRWYIDSAGDLAPNLANSYALGTTTKELSDIYTIELWIGTTQEMLLYHDGSSNGYVSVSTSDYLFLADSNKWAITPAGHLVPVPTGTYNVGSSANRILTFYAVNALNTSDIRFKTNIRENPFGLDFISRLNTSVFRLKEIDCKRYRCGMIAQQVNEVLSDLGYTYDDFTGTHYDKEEDRWDMNYTEFIAPLIKAVQELKYKVEVLEAAA